MEKELNKKGQKIIQIKKDYSIVSDATRNILDEELKTMKLDKNVIEMIKNTNKTVEELRTELLKKKTYKQNKEELLEENVNKISQMLEHKGLKYFSTKPIINNNEYNICIYKKIGVSIHYINKFFGFKYKTLNELQCSCDFQFIDRFMKLRFPIIIKDTIKILNKLYNNLNFDYSDIYISNKLNRINIDFLINIDIDSIVGQSNYMIEKKLNDIIDIFYIVNEQIINNNLYVVIDK